MCGKRVSGNRMKMVSFLLAENCWSWFVSKVSRIGDSRLLLRMIFLYILQDTCARWWMLRAVVWSATMRRYRRQQTAGHRINNTSSNSWVSARDPEKHRNPDLSNQSENLRKTMCEFNIYPRNSSCPCFRSWNSGPCAVQQCPPAFAEWTFSCPWSLKSARWDATVALIPNTRSLKIAPIILTVFFGSDGPVWKMQKFFVFFEEPTHAVCFRSSDWNWRTRKKTATSPKGSVWSTWRPPSHAQATHWTNFDTTEPFEIVQAASQEWLFQKNNDSVTLCVMIKMTSQVILQFFHHLAIFLLENEYKFSAFDSLLYLAVFDILDFWEPCILED